MTFTVLSFTSVRTGVKINRVPRNITPAYTGFLMRDKVWVQLEDTTPDVMRNEWGDVYKRQSEEDRQRYLLQLTPRGEVDWGAELERMQAQRRRMEQDLSLMHTYRATERIPLTVSLDLTSRSRQFGLVFAGHYYGCLLYTSRCV